MIETVCTKPHLDHRGRSDADPFGLEATAASLRRRIQRRGATAGEIPWWISSVGRFFEKMLGKAWVTMIIYDCHYDYLWLSCMSDICYHLLFCWYLLVVCVEGVDMTFFMGRSCCFSWRGSESRLCLQGNSISPEIPDCNTFNLGRIAVFKVCQIAWPCAWHCSFQVAESAWANRVCECRLCVPPRMPPTTTFSKKIKQSNWTVKLEVVNFWGLLKQGLRHENDSSPSFETYFNILQPSSTIFNHLQPRFADREKLRIFGRHGCEGGLVAEERSSCW